MVQGEDHAGPQGTQARRCRTGHLWLGGDPEEKLQVIETFFTRKARAAIGVKDIFDVHARAFYRDLALLEGDNPSRLRLGYIKVGEEVLATFSGTLGYSRLLIALCSLASGDLQHQSPGALLASDQGSLRPRSRAVRFRRRQRHA
jgi:hypothetical protein